MSKVILQRCTSPIGQLVGYVIHTPPDSDDQTYLVYADQKSMGGVRAGGHFTPPYGEKYHYSDMEKELSQLRSVLQEVQSCVDLDDEIRAVVEDALINSVRGAV